MSNKLILQKYIALSFIPFDDDLLLMFLALLDDEKNKKSEELNNQDELIAYSGETDQ